MHLAYKRKLFSKVKMIFQRPCSQSKIIILKFLGKTTDLMPLSSCLSQKMIQKIRPKTLYKYL